MNIFKLALLAIVFTFIGIFIGSNLSKSEYHHNNESNIGKLQVNVEPLILEEKSIEGGKDDSEDALLFMREQLDNYRSKLLAKEEQYNALSESISCAKSSSIDEQPFEDEQSFEDEQPLEKVALKIEDIEQTLAKPFSNLIADGTEDVISNFVNFTNEEKDFEWSYEIETKISDFIQMHELSLDIRIKSVNCKLSSCEVTGFDDSESSWDIIYKQMHKESWWPFNYSQTIKRTEPLKDGQPKPEKYFYALFFKNRV